MARIAPLNSVNSIRRFHPKRKASHLLQWLRELIVESSLSWSAPYRIERRIISDSLESCLLSLTMNWISNWIFRLSSCTSCRRFLQCSKDIPKQQPRSYFFVMSWVASHSTDQLEGQTFQPMIDNCSNRSHPKHKCNCPKLQLDSNVFWCSWLGNLTRPQLMGQIAQQNLSNLLRHILHKRITIHQMHKFRGYEWKHLISSNPSDKNFMLPTHQLLFVPIGVICLHSFVNGL